VSEGQTGSASLEFNSPNRSALSIPLRANPHSTCFTADAHLCRGQIFERNTIMTIKASTVPALAISLAAAFTVLLPQPARARNIAPPAVPFDLRVDPAANVPFLEGHAFGTQNYICLPTDDGFQFMLFTPEATLFDPLDPNTQLTTHFFSPNANPVPPNPLELGKIRATWQHSKDTSIVWGGNAIPSTDPNFVAKDAIAWLTLPMAGVKAGPGGGGILTATTFIQRVHTSGGVAPPEECTSMNDVGNKAFVPYTADYFFYRKR
jgi:Protein of unknown function (DUF3455)